MKFMLNAWGVLNLKKSLLSSKEKNNLLVSGRSYTSSNMTVYPTARTFTFAEDLLFLQSKIFPKEIFLRSTFWTGRSTDVSQLCWKNWESVVNVLFVNGNGTWIGKAAQVSFFTVFTSTKWVNALTLVLRSWVCFTCGTWFLWKAIKK